MMVAKRLADYNGFRIYVTTQHTRGTKLYYATRGNYKTVAYPSLARLKKELPQKNGGECMSPTRPDNHVLRGALSVLDTMRSAGLSYNQCLVLLTLEGSHGFTIPTISRETSLSKSTVGVICRELKRIGLVDGEYVLNRDKARVLVYYPCADWWEHVLDMSY